jgi:signal peptidase I
MSVTTRTPDYRPRQRAAEGDVRSQTVRQAVFLVLCTLTLSLFLKSFVVQLFTVPSASMEPTLDIGDKIAVTRSLTSTGTPHRGDIIVFRDPGGWLPEFRPPRSLHVQVLEFIGMIPYHSGEHLVKRVVGDSGDVVECRGPGPLYVNGAAVQEPFIAPSAQPCSTEFVVHVPARSVWVMGDNRDNSADSRYHLDDARQGSVPLTRVVGRVVLKIWPPTHWGRPG